MIALFAAAALAASPASPEEVARARAELDAENAAAFAAALAAEGLERVTLEREVVNVPSGASEWKVDDGGRVLVSPLFLSCRPEPLLARSGDKLFAVEERVQLPWKRRELSMSCEGPAKPAPPPHSPARCKVVVRFRLPKGMSFGGVREVTAPQTQLVTSCAAVEAAKRFCDRRLLDCKQPEPPCGAQETPVDGSCFGQCVSITACACDATHACPAGAQCRDGRCALK